MTAFSLIAAVCVLCPLAVQGGEGEEVAVASDVLEPPQIIPPEDPVTAPLREGPSTVVPRAGIWGLGLGLEFPYVGVPASFGSKGNVGIGYTFGGAATWAWRPDVELRLGMRWLVVRGPRPNITLLSRNEREKERQRAQWFDLEATAGLTYFVHADRRPWTTFVGADVGIGANGYQFFLGEDSLASDGASRAEVNASPSIADSLGVVAGVRFGVRLELAEWLSSIMQLSAGYARLGAQPVSGAAKARVVRSVPENIWTLMATFAVRLGL